MNRSTLPRIRPEGNTAPLFKLLNYADIGKQKEKTATIRFPPLRPEDKTTPLFKLLNDYYANIATKYEQKEQKTIKTLDRLEEKLTTLLSILQFLFLHVAYAHAMQSVPKTPSPIKKQLQQVSDFILTLDRDKYRGFLKRLIGQIDKLRKKAVQLNVKIVQDIDRLEQQQQRMPPLLFQSSPPLLLPPPSFDPNNQHLAPPVLQRQFTRSRGFQF
jgi:hypothetical protein